VFLGSFFLLFNALYLTRSSRTDDYVRATDISYPSGSGATQKHSIMQ